jgi:hypothetical protein
MTLQREVAGQFGSWVALLESVTRNNPQADPYDLLARPDVMRAMERSLANAQAKAQASLDKAWPPGSSRYRDRLQQDVEQAYVQAPAAMRAAFAQAFYSVQAGTFVPGVSTPGTNPVMRAAEQRATAVRNQLSSAAWHLGFRNEMTESVAGVRRAGEAVLAGAEPGWMKKWECRKDSRGRPDKRVCGWCRALDAMPAVPVEQEFPEGDYIGTRRPPRVYVDLSCPPRHPRCRCRIILVRSGTPSPAPSPREAPDLFVSADDVRAMSEGRYEALRGFHHAAVHELGQVLQKHREVGRQ